MSKTSMNLIKTPSFVFDIDALIERVNGIKSLLVHGEKLCYAIKANPFLVNDLKDVVDCFEICSTGEFRIAMRAGIPHEKVVLSGVYKEEGDIREIVGICKDKATYTVESPSQFYLLEKVANEYGLTLDVILRLSSGNQFGMDETTISSLVEIKQNALEIKGIQYYSGTQKKRDKILKEIESIVDFANKLEANGNTIERIEYGPGLRVAYFEGDEEVDEKAAIEEVSNAFAKSDNKREIVYEAGRFIAAYCGKYYTSIVDIKNTNGTQFCIVDGGINHLNYYGQTMAMKKPHIRQFSSDFAEKKDGEKQPCTICGSLCTVSDVLVKALPLEDVKSGDILEFARTGAYTVSEGIYLFLSRDMPRIYKKKEGKITLVRDVFCTDTLNFEIKHN